MSSDLTNNDPRGQHHVVSAVVVMCLQSVYGLDPQDDTHKTKYGSPTTLEVAFSISTSCDIQVIMCLLVVFHRSCSVNMNK